MFLDNDIIDEFITNEIEEKLNLNKLDRFCVHKHELYTVLSIDDDNKDYWRSDTEEESATQNDCMLFNQFTSKSIKVNSKNIDILVKTSDVKKLLRGLIKEFEFLGLEESIMIKTRL